MQASLMKRQSEANAAEAFCASRLEALHDGHAFGTLAPNVDFAGIVKRAALSAA
jgi:hypothetical protein